MSSDGWMDKQDMVYTYNGIQPYKEGNSGICYKINEPFFSMLNEKSQAQKDKYLYEISAVVKFIETEKG